MVLRTILLILVAGSAFSQTPKPPYERMLAGANARKAEQLETQTAMLRDMGKRDEAIKKANELLELRTKFQGDDHWEVRDVKQTIADMQRPPFTAEQQKQLDQADELSDASVDLYQAQKFAEAATRGEQALKIHETILGESLDTALTMSNLAGVYIAQGRLDPAETLYRRALKIHLREQGELHPDAAKTIHNLGVALLAREQYALAEEELVRSVRLRRDLYGPRHLNVSNSLVYLARAYLEQGKLERAAQADDESLAIRKESLGANHPQVAEVYSNMAVRLQQQGERTIAELFYRDALAIYRKSPGERHPIFASTLSHLAGLYASLGQYALAESMFREVLAGQRAILGDEHPQTILTLNALATMYKAQGKYADAEPLYLSALSHATNRHGEQHADVLLIQSNLATLYAVQRDDAKAEPRYTKAVALAESLYGKRHVQTAYHLNNLATFFLHRGAWSTAKPMLEQVLEQRRALLPKYHPDLALTLNSLGTHARATGDLKAAEAYFQEALAIRQATLGGVHPDTTISLNQLAALYYQQKRLAEAERLSAEATRSYEASRLLRASSTERSLNSETATTYPLQAAIALQRNQPQAAYAAIEHYFARGYLDEIAQRQGHTPANEEQRVKTLVRLQILEPRLVTLAALPQRSTAENEEKQRLATERRDLLNTLATLAGEASQREVADLKAIQATLPANAALVAWLDLDDRFAETSQHWGIVVRATGEPRWVSLPGQGPQGTWTRKDRDYAQQLVEAFVNPDGTQDLQARVAAVLAQRWTPLLKHLEGVEQVYVIATDAMSGVPVDTLAPERIISYVPSGTFLARRGKAVPTANTLLALGDPVFPPSLPHKLSTALPPNGVLITQLLPNGAAAKARLQVNDVIVAYAGQAIESLEQFRRVVAEPRTGKTVPIQFWREADDKVVERELEGGALGVVLAKEPARTALLNRRLFAGQVAKLNRGGVWDELPGTLAEVRELERLFPKEQATTLLQSNASEVKLEALRQQGKLAQFRYLHFATHGETNGVRAFDSKLILAQDQPKEMQAMKDRPLLNNELSASEVLKYWKLNADLVTLSACETALGKRSGGDGTLGFAQAFLLVGARSVCVSLWKVDDTATALLMDRFYRNILGQRGDGTKPMTKAAALHEAKQWLRNLTIEDATTRLGTLTDGLNRGSKKGREVLAPLPTPMAKENKPFAHPKYWAAFILVGQPD